MGKTKKPEDRDLQVSIKDGLLVIEIGINTLAFSAENGPLTDNYDPIEHPEPIKVLDPRKFSEDVVRALVDELGEDGSTMVTQTLDRAIEEAVEQGSLYIRLFPEDEDDDF